MKFNLDFFRKQKEPAPAPAPAPKAAEAPAPAQVKESQAPVQESPPAPVIDISFTPAEWTFLRVQHDVDLESLLEGRPVIFFQLRPGEREILQGLQAKFPLMKVYNIAANDLELDSFSFAGTENQSFEFKHVKNFLRMKQPKNQRHGKRN